LWTTGIKECSLVSGISRRDSNHKNPDNEKVLATVEVKTRVSQERIAEAERIAAAYKHKLIICIMGQDNIEEVMDKEHATQVLIQMATCQVNWGAYIVGQPGTSNTNGRILYTVLVYATDEIIDDFMSSTINMFDSVLNPFYNSTSIDDLEQKLLATLSSDDVKLIRSRWPFFTLAWSYNVPNMYYGLPACSVIKTAVQALYNS
jgi:hypothetical protein